MALGYFDANATPEQVMARKRELDYLASRMGGAQNVGQGIGDMISGLAVGFGRHKANKAEAAGRESGKVNWADILAKPQAPQVSGGEAFPNPAALPAQAQQTPPPQDFGGNSGIPASKSIPASALLQKPAQQAPAASVGKWLNYANQSAVRNKPLNPKLEQGLSFLPEMGVSMQVFSGGQDAKGQGNRRTGSTRHDHGNSADVFFERNGKKLDWRNPADIPALQEIVSRAKANGVTGFGAGEGYMQPGSMHIGLGSPAVWGAGGKGENAPEWLRQAYNTPYKGNAQAPAQVASNDPQFVPASASPQDVSQETMQPIPQPQQVAQAQPQGGQDLGKLYGILSNPWTGDQDKAIAQQMLAQQLQQQDPKYQMDMQSAQQGLTKGQLEIDAMRNPPKPKPIEVGGRLIDPETYQPLYEPPVDTNDAGEWGLQPIPVRDPKTGQLKLMITSKSGVQKLMDMPQGYEAAPNLQYLDTGTGFQPVDKRGGAIPQDVAPIAKDVAGEAAATAIGKEQGNAQATAPAAKITAEQTIGKIDELLYNPNLGRAFGAESYMPNSVAGVKDWVFGNPDGQTTVDLRSRIDQLRGSAFLEAYNGLRGGGQITEVEGKKAEDALARLDTAQTDGAAKQALKDFRDAVEQGYAKLAAKAGGKVPALSVAPLEKSVDQMTDQELEALVNGQ